MKLNLNTFGDVYVNEIYISKLINCEKINDIKAALVEYPYRPQ